MCIVHERVFHLFIVTLLIFIFIILHFELRKWNYIANIPIYFILYIFLLKNFLNFIQLWYFLLIFLVKLLSLYLGGSNISNGLQDLKRNPILIGRLTNLAILRFLMLTNICQDLHVLFQFNNLNLSAVILC